MKWYEIISDLTGTIKNQNQESKIENWKRKMLLTYCETYCEKGKEKENKWKDKKWY